MKHDNPRLTSERVKPTSYNQYYKYNPKTNMNIIKFNSIACRWTLALPVALILVLSENSYVNFNLGIQNKNQNT